MQVVKRDGHIVDFDRSKIVVAIQKANAEVEVEDKIEYVGNTSKTGAYMALMSSDVKREMEELAHEMDYLELGATENYERLLSECLIFPSFK